MKKQTAQPKTQNRYFATIQTGPHTFSKITVYGFDQKEAWDWANKTKLGIVTAIHFDGPAAEEFDEPLEY